MKKLYFTALLLGVVASGLVAYQVAKADIYGSSLVAWYTLDSNDISGTSVTDNSGSGNTGTTVNSPTLVTGKLAQALSFDGTSQYVTMAGAVITGTGEITITAWFKTTDTRTAAGTNEIISIGSNASTGQLALLGIENGVVYMRCVNEYVEGGSGYNDGKWHFVVATKPAGTDVTGWNIYVDTKALSLSSGGAGIGTTIDLSNNPTWIANYLQNGGATQYIFNGSLDDVRIYNRALSAAEVAALYYQGNGFSNSF